MHLPAHVVNILRGRGTRCQTLTDAPFAANGVRMRRAVTTLKERCDQNGWGPPTYTYTVSQAFTGPRENREPSQLFLVALEVPRSPATGPVSPPGGFSTKREAAEAAAEMMLRLLAGHSALSLGLAEPRYRVLVHGGEPSRGVASIRSSPAAAGAPAADALRAAAEALVRAVDPGAAVLWSA